MTSRKQPLQRTMSHPRDEQFQIQTLAQDSSQDSSRKDNQHYEVRYFDASDEQKQNSKNNHKQIKSMEDITETKDIQKQNDINVQQQKTKNQHVTSIQALPDINKQVVEQTQSNNVSCEDGIQKKKRKRQQIFINMRKNYKQKSQQSNKHTTKSEQNKKLKTATNRIAFEKKKENHILLKQWNYNRIHAIQTHRKIADQIINSIDKNVKQSMQNFEIYKSFYQQKFKQQQTHQKAKFAISQRHIENGQMLTQNGISRNVYIACSSAFQSISLKDRQQKQFSQQFSSVIQTKILKQLFEQYFDKIHKQSRALRDKIKTIAQTLSSLDQKICKKLIKLQTKFSQCCQNVNKLADLDFYRLELSFLMTCQSNTAMEIKLGEAVLQYLKYVISEQQIRAQIIQKSLKIYIQAYNKYQQQIKLLSRVKTTKKQSQSPLKIEPIKQYLINVKQIQSLYSIKNMVNAHTLSQIKQKMQKNSKIQSNAVKNGNSCNDEVPFERFKQIFEKLQLDQMNCNHLIMKKFQIHIFKQYKWIPGQIVITVDRYVHIFINAICNSSAQFYGSQKFYKPQITIKLQLIELGMVNKSTKSNNENEKQEINTDEQLQIVINSKEAQSGLGKIASFLISNKKVNQTVRFLKEDDLLEFQDYILDLSTT